MRMSQHFGATLRQPPAGSDTPGYELLLRAGYVRRLATGIFSYLPLGLRTARKIEAVLRAEMEAIGGQEVRLPVVQPLALWQQSSRVAVSDELTSFKDSAGRSLVLGPSHEEVALELARTEITSYRQLPVLLFEIQTSFRDEGHSFGGLLRAREFDLLDSYSFDLDREGARAQYATHRRAFDRICRRLGLSDVVEAIASVGDDEELGHEFVFLTPVGDDTVARCSACGYAAKPGAARFVKPKPHAEEEQKPLERVETPGTDTIASLAEFLEVDPSETAKIVLLSGVSLEVGAEPRDRLVMAVVRGDMEVSEAKVSAASGVFRLRPADAEGIRALGAEPGYASPVGLATGELIVVADDLVVRSPNLVSGANEAGYHYRNVNHDRDYKADVIADIAAAPPGVPCPRCGQPLHAEAGIEVASLHQFGTRLAEAAHATYQDTAGDPQPVFMNSYGMGVGRLLGCIAEMHRDEEGFCLPWAIAPFQVHLVALPGGDPAIIDRAEAIYHELKQVGLEVLYDDRDASGGVKFSDADLIGVPLRVTVAQRALERGGVELKRRDRGDRDVVGLPDAISTIQQVVLKGEAGE